MEYEARTNRIERTTTHWRRKLTNTLLFVNIHFGLSYHRGVQCTTYIQHWAREEKKRTAGNQAKLKRLFVDFKRSAADKISISEIKTTFQRKTIHIVIISRMCVCMCVLGCLHCTHDLVQIALGLLMSSSVMVRSKRTRKISTKLFSLLVASLFSRLRVNCCHNL